MSDIFVRTQLLEVNVPHIYAINELTPIPLSELAVGSVASFLDAEEALYVRVSHVPVAGGGTFIALDKTLTVKKVGAPNMSKRALILPPGGFRLSLRASAGRTSDVLPGQIVMTESGPVLGVLDSSGWGSAETLYVSMTTWEFVDFPARSWQMQDCKLLWVPEDERQEASILFEFN